MFDNQKSSLNSFFPEFQELFNPTQPWQQALIILLRLAFDYSERMVSTGKLKHYAKIDYDREIADWKEYLNNLRIYPQRKQDLLCEKLDGIHRKYYGQNSPYFLYEVRGFFDFNNNELGFQITQLFINLSLSDSLEKIKENLNTFFNLTNAELYQHYPCNSLDWKINEELQRYLNKTEIDDQDEDAPCSSSQASQRNNKVKEQWEISTINLIPFLSSIQSTLDSNKIDGEELKAFIEIIKANKSIVLPFNYFVENNGTVSNKECLQSHFEYFKSNTLRYFGIAKQPEVKETPCVFTEFFDYFERKEKFEVRNGFYQEKFLERLEQFLLLIQLCELLYEESRSFSGVSNALKEFEKHNKITTHGLTANKRYEELFKYIIIRRESDLYWHYHQWNKSGVKQSQYQTLLQWRDQYKTSPKSKIIPELTLKDKAMSIILICFENYDSHLERIICNNFLNDSNIKIHPLTFISYALRVEYAWNDTELKKSYLFLLHYLVETKQLIKYRDFQDDNGNNILHYMIYAKTNAFRKFLAVLKETVDRDISDFEKTHLFQLLTQQNKQGNTPLHLSLAPKVLKKAIDNVATHLESSGSQQQEIYVSKLDDNFGKHTYYNFIHTVTDFIPAQHCFHCLSISNHLDKTTALHLLIYNPDSLIRFVHVQSQTILPSNLDRIFSLLTVEEIQQFQQMKARIPRLENYFLTLHSYFDYPKSDVYFNAFMVLFFGAGLLAHAMYYASDPEYKKATKRAIGGTYTPVDLICDERDKRIAEEIFNQHTVFDKLFKYIEDRKIDLNKQSELINPHVESSSFFASDKKKLTTHDFVPELVRYIEDYVSDENFSHQRFQKSLEDNYIQPISQIGYLKSDLLPLLETIKSMDRELLVRRFNEIKPKIDKLRREVVSEETHSEEEPFALDNGVGDQQL